MSGGQETAVTLCPEGLATEVTLIWPLAAVDTQVYVQVVFLGEGVAAQVAHERTLVSVNANRKGSEQLLQRPGGVLGGREPQAGVPVDGFDVHLQAVSTGRAMTTLLTHERLFSPMFRRLVHAQLRTS